MVFNTTFNNISAIS